MQPLGTSCFRHVNALKQDPEGYPPGSSSRAWVLPAPPPPGKEERPRAIGGLNALSKALRILPDHGLDLVKGQPLPDQTLDHLRLLLVHRLELEDAAEALVLQVEDRSSGTAHFALEHGLIPP